MKINSAGKKLSSSMLTDRQTDKLMARDMMKLQVTFHNFENTPKNQGI
jgi:hypothetical protein